jgi:hypothetical protein
VRRDVKTGGARPGHPLGLGLCRHPGPAEHSHDAPPATYPLAAAPGKPLPRPARPRRHRPGLVLLRHDPRPGQRTLHRRLLPRPASGTPVPRPAQAPARVLPGGPRQVRRQAGPQAQGLRRRHLLRPPAPLGARPVVGPAPAVGHRRHQPRRPLPRPVRQRGGLRHRHPRRLEGAARRGERPLGPALGGTAAGPPRRRAGRLDRAGAQRPRPGVGGPVPLPPGPGLAPADARQEGGQVQAHGLGPLRLPARAGAPGRGLVLRGGGRLLRGRNCPARCWRAGRRGTPSRGCC